MTIIVKYGNLRLLFTVLQEEIFMLQPNNEFFREVTLRISSSLDVGEALHNLFEYIKDIVPAKSMMLSYRSKDGFYLVAAAGERSSELQEINPYQPTLFLEESEIERLEAELSEHTIAVDSTRILLPNGAKAMMEIVQRRLPHFNIMFTCMLNTILEIRNEIIGEIVMFADEGVTFSREHAVLLESVKEPIAIAMSNARRYLELERLKDMLVEDNRDIRRELYAISGDQVVGAEFGLKMVMEMVRNVAPLNSPVLLLGETGTGKEVIANAIHHNSPRKEKPLVRVQCGAIPNTLLDSELFGHEKGAFTGALSLKRGRFERADGGTIFLDEIGELTLDAQVKLLRVLQEKEIERLGGSETIKVDVRVIAATHRDLLKMVAEGTFREDLYFRLNVFPIIIPPLRERKEDIYALTIHFINRKCREMGLAVHPPLTAEALQQLQNYNWPGNVRELQNVIERALIISRGNPLHFPDLGNLTENMDAKPSRRIDFPCEADYPASTLDDTINRKIRQALVDSRGKVHGPGGAAEILGVNPSTLRYQMRKRRIPFGRKL